MAGAGFNAISFHCHDEAEGLYRIGANDKHPNTQVRSKAAPAPSILRDLPAPPVAGQDSTFLAAVDTCPRWASKPLPQPGNWDPERAGPLSPVAELPSVYLGAVGR